jgi:shikimate dehydrogenase
VLFDIGYGHGERRLARAWREAGGTVIDGLQLLLFQAVRQIRIFTGGDPELPIPDEQRVIAAMRAAVGL